MANYRKSFNFRNGVQVDTDNFIVNSLGLVGLGTTAPTELFDVYGNIRSTGIVTTSDLFVGSAATITSSLTVGSAVTITSSGIDLGAGIVTATSFVGGFTGTVTGTATTATNLADGANITTGTIDDARLPDLITSNINISSGISTVSEIVVGSGVTINSSGINAAAGVVTATSFVGALTGNADTATTAQGLTGTPNINVGVATATSAVVGSAVTINSSGVDVTGVVTATSAVVGSNVTINSSGINVSGAVTATSFVGDGSGLTSLAGIGSGVVVQNSGSPIGTAGTINFGTALTVTPISAGIVTVNNTGISSVFDDINPQLSGNLDLNTNNINGSGGINITNLITAVAGFSTNGADVLTFNGSNIEIIVSSASSTITFNAVGIGSTSFTLA